MNNLHHWSVLIVDDEPDSLNMLSEMLSLNGAEVHGATSGEEGLRLLRDFTPTLIVLDLSMPHPDGWDLLQAIRTNESTAQVPVIAVTAFYSEKVVDEVNRVGFDAFLPKPIKLNGLISKLQELLPA